jgi:hypothetical protein
MPSSSSSSCSSTSSSGEESDVPVVFGSGGAALVVRAPLPAAAGDRFHGRPYPNMNRRGRGAVVSAGLGDVTAHSSICMDMVSQRVQQGTAKAYRSNFAHFVQYCKAQPGLSSDVSQCFNDADELQAPITTAMLSSYLGYLKSVVAPSSELGAWKPGTYEHYKSAIVHFHKIASLQFDPQCTSIFDSFHSAYKIIWANMQVGNEGIGVSGKAHLSEAAYHMLAKKAITMREKNRGSWRSGVKLWAYMILDWNLACRSKSVQEGNVGHLKVVEDHLGCKIPKSKKDPTGARSFHKALLDYRDSCVQSPVLALAVLFALGMFARNGAWFSGKHAEKSFSRRFGKLLRNCRSAAELEVLAQDPKDLGTHSVRKGIMSLLAGVLDGPNDKAMSMRCDHSKGKTHDTYYQAEGGTAQDCLCGRISAGFRPHDINNTQLPPHFAPGVVTDEHLRKAFPTFDAVMQLDFKKQLRPVLTMLLASLVHHTPELKSVLGAEHPVFSHRAWSSKVVEELKSSVLLGDMTCPVTGMHVSGVNATLTRLAGLEKKLECYHAEMIGMPMKVAEVFRQQFVVNGVAAVTQADLQMFATLLERRIDAAVDRMQAGGGHQRPSAGAATGRDVHLRQHQVFGWEHDVCNYRFVPRGFPYAVVPCAVLWDLWSNGDDAAGVRPYKDLYPRHMPSLSAKRLCGKARTVMLALEGTNQPTFEGAFAQRFGDRDCDVLFTTAANYCTEGLAGQQEQRNEKRARCRESQRLDAQLRIQNMQAAVAGAAATCTRQPASPLVEAQQQAPAAAKKDRRAYFANYNARKRQRKDAQQSEAAHE